MYMQVSVEMNSPGVYKKSPLNNHHGDMLVLVSQEN